MRGRGPVDPLDRAGGLRSQTEELNNANAELLSCWYTGDGGIQILRTLLEEVSRDQSVCNFFFFPSFLDLLIFSCSWEVVGGVGLPCCSSFL